MVVPIVELFSLRIKYIAFMSFAKFVVLTTARTGSTWLIDVLNMQSGVEAHGELFLNRPRSTPAISGHADSSRFVELYRAAGLTRVPKVFSYLSALYRAPRTVGFKLMYSQLRDYPEILLYLAAKRVRVVHLVRPNFIDVIVSDELAKLTGLSHAKAGSKLEIPKIYLNPETLVDRIRRCGRAVAQARRLIWLSTCPSLEVTYEALLQREPEFTRICQFLDIAKPTTLVRSSLEKRGTRSHQEAVVNYDEVEHVLKSTSFSSMLR